MNKIIIKQVDAFTSIPFGGNPAGVVTDANSIDDFIKQKIAKEMNLSETAFVSSSDKADFKVQFFTPKFEVDLCGHATIATFNTLYKENKLDLSKDKFYQETKAGVLPVEIRNIADKKIFMMTQVNPKFINLDHLREEIAQSLNISRDDLLPYPMENVSTGLWWLVFGVKDLEILKNITPNLDKIYKLSDENNFVGISLFTMETFNHDCTYHVRSIAPYCGVAEDPVCGTGNGSVSSYIFHHKLIDKNQSSLIGEQGHFVERPGKVYVEIQSDIDEIIDIKIGGEARTILEGEILY